MIKRIAVTQRVVNNNTYPERRDALAQDWASWLARVFPRSAAMAVPNRPDGLDAWYDAAGPDALVMTGGNDWGDAPERDEVECQLVGRARENALPILGVCRGMQVLNIILGGKVITDLGSVTEEQHIAQDHPVRLSGTMPASFAREDEITVNSYHGQGITKSGVAESMVVFAETADGVVEGFYHQEEPIVAIQWHPERQSPSAEFDANLVRTLFERGAFWTGASA